MTVSHPERTPPWAGEVEGSNYMLDINLIRKSPAEVKRGVAAKNTDSGLVDNFLDLDETFRKLVKETDDLRQELNEFSKERKVEKAKAAKTKLKGLEEKLAAVETERQQILYKLPNLPEAGWLIGQDESANKVIKESGQKPKFDFTTKDYLTLAENLGVIDTARAAKVAGSRFGYLFNEAVLLEFALVQLALQKLIQHGFKPVIPPVMIKPEVFRGMGRLTPGQEEERYFLPKDNLYLAGSAEHTLGPIHLDEVLEEKNLPLRYVGFSTCFRREAGSYGKDTKGILRVHQFDKVEMFSFARPHVSSAEHQFLLTLQEELMQELGLPYRVVQVCSGDMGWPDAAQYDIETWLPGQNQYRETHSCSNTGDFQARGINVKYKTAQGNQPVHMLNATAVAIGRMLIAIIENYQNADGSITVPKALQAFCDFKKVG